MIPTSGSDAPPTRAPARSSAPRRSGRVSQDEADRRWRSARTTASTTSTPRRATATRSSAWAPGWSATASASSWHQDRRAHLRRRARADPALPGAPAGRAGRPDPAAQPGPARRSGTSPWARTAPSGRASRPARRGWCASSASPVTVTGSPACTGAPWSASTSTRCCCPTTTPCCRTAAYAADFEALLAVCQERDVAVQTIKAHRPRPLGGRPQTRPPPGTSPCEEQGDIDLAVHWVLGRPGVFLNTVGDVHVLPRVLDAGSASATARRRGDAAAFVVA